MGVVRLALSARKDLEDIRDWLSRGSPEQAARYLQSLADTFERVADMPMMGRSRSDIRPPAALVRPWRLHDLL